MIRKAEDDARAARRARGLACSRRSAPSTPTAPPGTTSPPSRIPRYPAGEPAQHGRRHRTSPGRPGALKATPPRTEPFETAGSDAEPSIPEAIRPGPSAHELAPAEAGGAPRPARDRRPIRRRARSTTRMGRFTAADDERRAMEADDDGGPPPSRYCDSTTWRPTSGAVTTLLRDAQGDARRHGATEGDDEIEDGAGRASAAAADPSDRRSRRPAAAPPLPAPWRVVLVCAAALFAHPRLLQADGMPFVQRRWGGTRRRPGRGGQRVVAYGRRTAAAESSGRGRRPRSPAGGTAVEPAIGERRHRGALPIGHDELEQDEVLGLLHQLYSDELTSWRRGTIRASPCRRARPLVSSGSTAPTPTRAGRANRKGRPG